MWITKTKRRIYKHKSGIARSELIISKTDSNGNTEIINDQESIKRHEKEMSDDWYFHKEEETETTWTFKPPHEK